MNCSSANVLCHTSNRLKKPVTPYTPGSFAAWWPVNLPREALMRKGLVNHADHQDEIFVCPHCGLIFLSGRPDQCPVDETSSETFIFIQ